jgi:hypothetical protein
MFLTWMCWSCHLGRWRWWLSWCTRSPPCWCYPYQPLTSRAELTRWQRNIIWFSGGTYFMYSRYQYGTYLCSKSPASQAIRFHRWASNPSKIWKWGLLDMSTYRSKYGINCAICLQIEQILLPTRVDLLQCPHLLSFFYSYGSDDTSFFYSEWQAIRIPS